MAYESNHPGRTGHRVGEGDGRDTTALEKDSFPSTRS